MVTSVTLPHPLTLYTTGGGGNAAGWVHFTRRHCSPHLGYTVWSGHGWCGAPDCVHHVRHLPVRCLPVCQACEFVSLASGNFGSPYVVPTPTSPPSLTRMSVGSVPGSSSEGVCPSTSSRDNASARRSSLEDQEVRDQVRLESHPSPVVQAPVVPPVPPLETSVQPPAPFTVGQAREQRAAAASCPAATVTWSAPAVSAVAPAEPRVSTSVVLPSGTATVVLPGRPQVPPGEGVPSSEPDGLCGYPGSGENVCATRSCSSEDALTSTVWQPGCMATSALPH